MRRDYLYDPPMWLVILTCSAVIGLLVGYGCYFAETELARAFVNDLLAAPPDEAAAMTYDPPWPMRHPWWSGFIAFVAVAIVWFIIRRFAPSPDSPPTPPPSSGHPRTLSDSPSARRNDSDRSSHIRRS